MEMWYCTAAAVLFIAAVIWIWYTHRHMRRIMAHMITMIEAAEGGSFREKVYDESMLSAVETRLAHYLAALEVSACHCREEKEKVEQLITDISHQTKTPVANLLLYAQMLEERGLAQEEQAFVKELSRQAQKLSFLITSLVKASRLETGMLVLHSKLDFVSPMLEEVLGQIAPKAAEKGLTVEFTPECLQAFFDPKWTAEAIYNIVDNAVKYTPSGGNIRIALMNTELFARIEIQDTGIGISEMDTAKIFQRFYRGRSVSEVEGVGIGLYLARQIIAEENGYMKVKSAVGKGTSFFVYLPAAPGSGLTA